MIIEFEKISFKNFLSFGDTPTEVNLKDFKTTLVTGANFSGKSSSILDTITFALFGRPFRNINKPQLINVYNKKNCLVELTFTKNKTHYRIVRGIKPNVFEIYRDGEQFDIQSSSKDQQDEFEKTILNFTYQTFQQIVVLGSANYIPFMKMKPNDRRQVVDDILNLHVFTQMNDLLRNDISETKSEIQSIDNQLYLKSELLQQKEDYLESLKNINVSSVDKEEVDALLKKIKDIVDQQEAKRDELDNLDIGSFIEEDDLLVKIRKYEKVKEKIMYSVNSQKKTYDFFIDNYKCPTCEQEIEESFRQDKINSLKTSMLEKKEGVEQLVDKISELRTEKHKVDNHNSLVQYKIQQRGDLLSDIEKLKIEHGASTDKYRYLQKPQTLDNEKIHRTEQEIQQLKDQIQEYQEQLDVLHNDAEVQKDCSFLLKDSGIKSLIMNKYLNLLNKNMEFYLKKFGLKLNFELDSSFNEKITNFSGHSFSYYSLSEGEKLRVDLSMMLSWRTLAIKRAKMKTNLLILDEVMDGAADSSLQHEIVSTLHDLKDTNVFVISHRTEGLVEKFQRNLHVTRHIGFSNIQETLI